MKKFILISLLLFLGQIVISQTTVEATASNVSTTSDYIEWLDLDKANVLDGVGIFTEVCSNAPSSDLILKDFGFDIPQDALIRGITLTVVKRATGEVMDQTVSLYFNNTPVGENKADTQWPETWSTFLYGDDSDIWGTTWTPEEINNPEFGAVISTTPAVGYCLGAEIDYISISVTYTGTMGINNLSVEKGYSIFPNPVTENLNIISDYSIENLSVFDISGQKFLVYQNSGPISTLSTKDLSAGVYIVKAVVNGNVITKKFVKH